MAVALEDVRVAAATIAGQVVRTPCVVSRTLSSISAADLFLKFENLQFTGSFKDRGALNRMSRLTAAERAAGVVAMSAGNHAQAVAYHAQRLGIPATVVMPRFTPNVKVEQTRSFGAEVILHGQDLNEAAARADEIVRERGRLLVHPYDDALVIAGQGTIGLEVLEEVPELDALVVPVGGGGLISGIAVAAKALRPEIHITGVQASRYPSMVQALAGEPVVCGLSTLAEGIAVKRPGQLTLPLIRNLVDEIVLVEEAEIEAAVLLLLEVEKTVVEGAGAAGLAAVLQRRDLFEGRRTSVIVSGGNLDLMMQSQIIERGLVRSQRLARISVAIPDNPGGLAAVTRVLADRNANIIQVRHQRAFTHLALRSVEAEFVLQTLGSAHVEEILAALRAAGYEVVLTSA